jgi:unsaturated rhamnogalacturonyl hydrolase
MPRIFTKTVKLLIHQLVNIEDQTEEFPLRLENGCVIDKKGWKGWEYTHRVGLCGIWGYCMLTWDGKSLAIINAWFAARFAEGDTRKNIHTMAMMLTLECPYETTRDHTFLHWLDSWAEWAMYDLPRAEYGWMLHMMYNSKNRSLVSQMDL